MKIWQKALFMGLTITLLGCGGEEKKNNLSIAQRTKEALGENNNNQEIGCDDNKTGKECSEKSSSSNFILNKLEKKSNQNENNSLRTQLNNLLEDIQKEEDNSSSTTEVTKEIENLVEIYDKENNKKSIKNELENLVENVENSKLKREELEIKLLSLVDDAHKQQIKKEEVKEKLLEIVESASKKQKKSLKQIQLNLENLVSSAEKQNTKEAKRLASSIIKDVSQKKIKILRAEDRFIVIRVQTGDSLSALAEKYYGDAKKYKIIYEANKNKIGNRHTIYPGTTLVIPKLETTN